MLSAFFRFLGFFCRPCTVPPFAIDQFRLSIRLSVRDKSEHCKNGEKKGLWGVYQYRATPGPISNPLRPPLPQTEDPQPSAEHRQRCGFPAFVYHVVHKYSEHLNGS